MKNTPKIAVLHDAFLYRGWGERLVTLMAKSLSADLISWFFSEWSFIPEELWFQWKKIPLGKPVFTKWLRHLILKSRFHRAWKILQNYDIIILSWNCLDVIPYISPSTKIFYYCHTPPRYLFDFREMYLEKFPSIFRGIIQKFFDRQAKKYISLLEKVNVIFTNSQNVHDRLLHFCNKESIILYPPTDTDNFTPYHDYNPLENLPKEYYLSFSRLSPPKRVDMIIRAFMEIPDKNLVFTYGANDPLKDELLNLCKNYNNIFPIPAPSDKDFIRLIQHSLATIYIPIDEDFGMSPVESMACGIPVIGVNDGWLKETIIHEQTGFLLPKNISKEDIISTIKNTSKNTLMSMKDNCTQRANNFSLSRFISRLQEFTSHDWTR